MWEVWIVIRVAFCAIIISLAISRTVDAIKNHYIHTDKQNFDLRIER